MNNDITINPAEILKLPDNSIDDYETIRQIGLATTKWNFLTDDISRQLTKKIKSGYEIAALYPHIIYKLEPFKISGMSIRNA